MIIVFGRPVYHVDMRVSPVLRHVGSLARWRDTLSYDTTLIMSEIDGELPDDVVEAIRVDPDVFTIVDLDPDPIIPGPESGNSGERNPDKKLSQAGFENALRGARRHNIPESLIDEDMTYERIVNIFRERMLTYQALGEDPPDAPLVTARRIREKLNRAGFDIEEDDAENIRDVINNAVKKGAVNRGNPRKR